MAKPTYTRVDWKNYPNQTTPIDAPHLNTMDEGIYDITEFIQSCNPLGWAGEEYPSQDEILVGYNGEQKATGSSISINDVATQEQLSTKQDVLVSGTNIKTINGEDILGSGDITISAGIVYVTKPVDFDNLTLTEEITNEEYELLMNGAHLRLRLTDSDTFYYFNPITSYESTEEYLLFICDVGKVNDNSIAVCMNINKDSTGTISTQIEYVGDTINVELSEDFSGSGEIVIAAASGSVKGSSVGISEVATKTYVDSKHQVYTINATSNTTLSQIVSQTDMAKLYALTYKEIDYTISNKSIRYRYGGRLDASTIFFYGINIDTSTSPHSLDFRIMKISDLGNGWYTMGINDTTDFEIELSSPSNPTPN